ncbi:Golgi apparatus membrane protein TVP23 B [Clonorchis sinensis]|uniref:Golgi apparatus membrane protein TVP23 homolog n=1 Tax=Clonorchis sinensis TaxID=79923 RepID=A0A8T1MZS3_CLOSI|nr:Golgi apparatus membrane protein TVP23 B [Clonorchis sinensis]
MNLHMTHLKTIQRNEVSHVRMMNTGDEVVLALTDDLDTGDSHDGGQFPPSSRRLALAGHFLFRTMAILIYFFCTWFTSSFVVPFVLVLISLSLDFWFVKNISGRILAGLRWSSYTDEEGHTRWRFDSRPAAPEPAEGVTLTRREVAARAAQANAARLFWIGLVVTPVVWVVFLLASIFTLHLRWALVCGIALCMSGVNLYAFCRCSLADVNQNVLSSLQAKVARQMFTDFWSNLTKKPATGAGAGGTGSSVGKTTLEA